MSFWYFCVASCNDNAIFVCFSLICRESLGFLQEMYEWNAKMLGPFLGILVSVETLGLDWLITCSHSFTVSVFEIFEKMWHSDFSYKKGEVGKIGGCFKKWGRVSLIFILTLSSVLFLWVFGVCLCMFGVCLCVFHLSTPFLSFVFVFHRKDLVL